MRAIEEKLLTEVNGRVDMTFEDHEISGNFRIHSAKLVPEEKKADNKARGVPLVILPGYGAGIGFFTRNVKDLEEAFSTHSHDPRAVHLIDWLGTGLSSRPPFTAKSVDETEEFFTRSLEEWRELNDIQEMVLIGHSLGGYLSFAYAERYPHRVRKLVLSSPAGVPNEPEGWKERIYSRIPRYLHWLPPLISVLWSNNISPGDFIRWIGPLGPRFVEYLVNFRFHNNGTEDLNLLSEYAYHNFAARGSGEYALGNLLVPGAFAKKPLHARIRPLSEKGIQDISFIYGQRDWMNFNHALKVSEDNPDLKIPVEVVPHAGHQLHIHNPSGFLESLEKVIRK